MPAPDRMSLGEAIATIAFGLFVLVAIVWVQVASPIVIEGTAYPLFDPATFAWWLWYVLALTVAEIVFAAALYLRGRWTWGFAVVNAVLAAALAIPAVYLIQQNLLLNDELVAAVDAQTTGGLVQHDDGDHGARPRAGHRRSTRSTGSARPGAPPRQATHRSVDPVAKIEHRGGPGS